jgi:hypothetical protein
LAYDPDTAPKVTPFTIEPKKPSTSFKTTKLTNTIRNVKHVYDVPTIDENNAELICYSCLMFDAAAQPSALHLHTAAQLLAGFRRCLGYYQQRIFNAFYDQQHVINGNQDTVLGFHTARQQFVIKLIGPDALFNLGQYLRSYVKPRKLDCTELATRLQEINSLTVVLNGGNLRWTEQELKEMFFPMIPQYIRDAFNINGNHMLTDPTVTLDRLAQSMQMTMVALQNMSSRGQERRRQQTEQGGERPQQMRRFNNGGRGHFSDGRWNNNWRPNNYYNNNHDELTGDDNRGYSNGGNRGPQGNQSGYRGSYNGGGRGYQDNNGGNRSNGGRGFGSRNFANQSRGYNAPEQQNGNGNNGRPKHNSQQGRHDDNFHVETEQEREESVDESPPEDAHRKRKKKKKRQLA